MPCLVTAFTVSKKRFSIQSNRTERDKDYSTSFNCQRNSEDFIY